MGLSAEFFPTLILFAKNQKAATKKVSTKNPFNVGEMSRKHTLIIEFQTSANKLNICNNTFECIIQDYRQKVNYCHLEFFPTYSHPAFHEAYTNAYNLI